MICLRPLLIGGAFFMSFPILDMIISTASNSNTVSLAEATEEQQIESLQHELIVAMQAVEHLNAQIDKHCTHAIVDHQGRLLHIDSSVSECVEAGILHNYFGKIVRHRWNHNNQLVETGNWLDAQGLYYFG